MENEKQGCNGCPNFIRRLSEKEINEKMKTFNNKLLASEDFVICKMTGGTVIKPHDYRCSV